eukprot:8668035-Lingulodinium_polyedra.AAC.1
MTSGSTGAASFGWAGGPIDGQRPGSRDGEGADVATDSSSQGLLTGPEDEAAWPGPVPAALAFGK